MNKGGNKGSGQGNRAFQSVNNFFNPRTAGAQKHPNRERISPHHFHGNKNENNIVGYAPMSPSAGNDVRN